MVQYIIEEKNTDNKRVHPTRTYMETQNTVRIQFSAQRVLSKFITTIKNFLFTRYNYIKIHAIQDP